METDSNQLELQALAKKRRTRLFAFYNIVIVLAIFANFTYLKYSQNSQSLNVAQLNKQIEEIKSSHADLNSKIDHLQIPTLNKTLGVIDAAQKSTPTPQPTPTSTPIPTPADQITITKIENSSSKIPIYQTADTKSEIVGTLNPGKSFPMISENQEWFLIDITTLGSTESDFTTGWVSKLKTKKVLPDENNL